MGRFWKIFTVLAILAMVWIALMRAIDEPATSYIGPTGEVLETAVYQSEVEEGLGASVVILVDTSASMGEPAPGSDEPKYLVAREALRNVLRTTKKHTKKRPDFPIKLSIYGFASDPHLVLPVQRYDHEAVKNAVDAIPLPGGGTAIGRAMLAGRRELYRSGTYRKYLLVVTDGQNTVGRDPAPVAEEIYVKSEGSVEVYFVAFDIDPELFNFVAGVGGEVVSASDKHGLARALTDIYEGKILAEAVDYGETALDYQPGGGQ